MLAELLRSSLFGPERLDILNLHLADYFVDVGIPLFDQRKERAVGEGPVGTAEREVIGEFGYSHAEVGGYIAWCPYVAEIPPLANEGEAGSPLLCQLGWRIRVSYSKLWHRRTYQEVSKPVAQMMTSTSCSLPS